MNIKLLVFVMALCFFIASSVSAITLNSEGFNDGDIFNVGETYVFNFEALDYTEKYPVYIDFKLYKNGVIYDDRLSVNQVSAEFNSNKSTYSWEVPFYIPTGDYDLKTSFRHQDVEVSKKIKINTNRTIFPNKITKPSAGEVVSAGEVFTIDLNNIPVNIDYLSNVYLINEGDTSHIDLNRRPVLSSKDGIYTIKIPKDTAPGDDYQLFFRGSNQVTLKSDSFTISSNFNPNKEYKVHFELPTNSFNINDNYILTLKSDCPFTTQFSVWIDLGKESDGFYRIHPLTTIDYDFSTQRFYYENVIRGDVDIFNIIYNSLPNGQVEITIPGKTGWYKYVQTSWSGLTPYFVKTYHDGDKTIRTTIAENLGEEGLQKLENGQYRFFATVSGYDQENGGAACIANGFSDSINIGTGFEKVIKPTGQEQNNDVHESEIIVSAKDNKILVNNVSMYSRLRGKIMLKVEDAGKAYYIHPQSQEMHYLGRPDDAFFIMREQGVGITTANLEKIPLGLDNLSGPDSDGDGLSDLFEDAIGTDKNNKDTDGDGYYDKVELVGDFSPRGGGKFSHDTAFANLHKGKIFLQIEGAGEAWYINPNNGKRYFLGRPADAFNVMRNLGLGISNSDFESL